MEQKNINKRKRNIVFAVFFICSILLIAGFNYFIDPYYIFRDKTFKAVNNVKLHKYTNKRTILYSDIKINKFGKDTVFTGNCLLSNYGYSKGHIAFFTIPQAKVFEIYEIISNIMLIAPNVKTIYWGLFFDDLYNEFNDEVTDTLPKLDNKNISLNDIINLFLSWNTTKYSIETFITSVKNKGKDIKYIYPFREIAPKKYIKKISFEDMNKINDIVEKANKKGVNIIFYYSPIHVSKKIDLYEKGVWGENMEFKRRLAQITPFIDYSVFTEYNSSPLDKNSVNYIDNIHPTDIYNNMIAKDILAKEHKIGVITDKNNVEYWINKETEDLKDYINKNSDYVKQIKDVTISDVGIKIPVDF